MQQCANNNTDTSTKFKHCIGKDPWTWMNLIFFCWKGVGRDWWKKWRAKWKKYPCVSWNTAHASTKNNNKDSSHFFNAKNGLTFWMFDLCPPSFRVSGSFDIAGFVCPFGLYLVLDNPPTTQQPLAILAPPVATLPSKILQSSFFAVDVVVDHYHGRRKVNRPALYVIMSLLCHRSVVIPTTLGSLLHTLHAYLSLPSFGLPLSLQKRRRRVGVFSLHAVKALAPEISCSRCRSIKIVSLIISIIGWRTRHRTPLLAKRTYWLVSSVTFLLDSEELVQNFRNTNWITATNETRIEVQARKMVGLNVFLRHFLVGVDFCGTGDALQLC